MSDQLAQEILDIAEDDALKVSGKVSRIRDAAIAELQDAEDSDDIDENPGQGEDDDDDEDDEDDDEDLD